MKMRFIMFTLSVGLLTGCATTPKENPVPDNQDNDPMIVQLSSTARRAFESGETASAVVMYRRALERARAMDNSREIGRNAHNLAACLLALDEYDEATGLLAEAERETIRAGDDAGPVLLLSAQTARMRRQWKNAEAAINRLEQNTNNDQIRGQAYVERAHIACARKDVSKAEGFLNRARGYLRKNEDPGLAGSIAEVSGLIAMLKEDWLEAAKSFDREAAWMQRSNRPLEIAKALEHAGQNYIKVGNIDLAADRFYRSARSLMAQGAYLDALRVIEQAVQSHDQDGEENHSETAEAIARLFDDIRQSVEKNSRAGVSAP